MLIKHIPLTARLLALLACLPYASCHACLRSAPKGALPHPSAAGPADDLLPLVLRTNNLEAAAPLSGTSLFADCWCIPAAAAGG